MEGGWLISQFGVITASYLSPCSQALMCISLTTGKPGTFKFSHVNYFMLN